MSTKTAVKKTDTKEMSDEKNDALKSFFFGLFDLTWRLLGAMLLPIFIGLFIDSKLLGHGKTFAVIGFFVGIIAGVAVIWQIIKKAKTNV